MSESVYYLPVMLNCQGQHCLVVGGGKVAERKTTGLIVTIKVEMYPELDKADVIFSCMQRLRILE